MAFYDKFPYTNFQELNLDWLTQEVSKVRDNRDATDASAAAALASEQAAKASETAAAASQQASAASQQAAANSETAAAGSAAESAEYLEQIGTHTAGAAADWLKENLQPTTPPVDATLTVSGAAADAKKTGDAVSDLNAAMGQETSFVKCGKISAVIKNVKVYGSGTIRYAITNINRNYNDFTGVVIYQVSGGTFVSGVTILLSELTGHVVKILGREIVEFDYDLSVLADESRIVTQDDTAIINLNRYVKSESLVSVGVTAKALSNILVVLNNKDTIYLGKITRTAGNTGTVSLYTRANSYAEVAVITLSALTGSAKYTSADLGIEVSFDYDISWMSANQTISDYVDAHGEVKTSRVVLKIPEILNYASAGLFESMGVIGDSYASGWIYRTDDTERPYRCWDISWIQIMARKLGNEASNFSFGGMTTRSWLTHANGKAKLESESAKQIYFLCLGINDVALGSDYIGTGADYNNDADTFIGNYSHIIRIIQAHAPNARIIMFTTPFTSNSTYVAYNNNIITIARHFALPYIEQYLHPYIASNAFQNGLQSGHPNAVMYSCMEKAYEELIADTLINYPDYFKNFTGSGRNN